MTAEVLAAEDAFFGALLAADRDALAAVLAPDFAIVDVLAGQLVPRDALLGAVGSGELAFTEIVRDPDVSLRQRPGIAVVAGRTRMTMRYGDAETTVDSTYTHVYVADDGGWRLLAAQGTRRPDSATGAG